jgi:hypothetical protein
MSRQRIDPAVRAYLRRFVPTMILYVALVALTPALIRATGATGPLLWVIAILPALPIIAVFWLIGRLLIELRDEYLQMLEVRKALVATGVTMSIAAGWGFLEIYADAPHLPLFFVPVIWFAGLGIGAVFNVLFIHRASDT